MPKARKRTSKKKITVLTPEETQAIREEIDKFAKDGPFTLDTLKTLIPKAASATIDFPSIVASLWSKFSAEEFEKILQCKDKPIALLCALGNVDLSLDHLHRFSEDQLRVWVRNLQDMEWDSFAYSVSDDEELMAKILILCRNAPKKHLRQNPE